ncbi:MAG: right-handed parallel beta-helix repeat-containing protein [Phycisphaerales bacterium]|nr:MAG: right-handed parallel beta-helix repeat-containing protein [Phycisphaerales bacterium]
MNEPTRSEDARIPVTPVAPATPGANPPAPAHAIAPAGPATHRRAMLAGIGGLAAGALLTGKAHAGPLDPPPGPVTSTGKPLTDIEPRIAINQTNTPGDASNIFRITQPGSYYLTGDVLGASGRNGINIAVGDVSIDLNGYSLIGVPGSLRGIRTTGLRNNFRIVNGVVSGWGQGGVSLTSGGFGVDSLIENVTAFANGGDGIRANSNAIVRACRSRDNNGVGVAAQENSIISDCNASGNTSTGIVASASSRIENCVAANSGAFGIFLNAAGGTVIACIAEANGLEGIRTGNDTVIQQCVARSNGRSGIYGDNGCTISQCTAANNNTTNDGSAAGIRTLSRSTIIGCASNDNGSSSRGIYTSSQSTVADCAASGNAIGIDVLTGSSVLRCAANNNSTGVNGFIGCHIGECVSANNSNRGILIQDGSTVSGCVVFNNGSSGIQCGSNTVVSGCHLRSNSTGILFTSQCRIERCAVSNSTSHGIRASGDGNHIEGNSCYSNTLRGVWVQGTGNYIAGNTCRANGTNWDVISGNKCLVVNGVNAGAILGNAGGTSIGSNVPTANFTY